MLLLFQQMFTMNFDGELLLDSELLYGAHFGLEMLYDNGGIDYLMNQVFNL